MIPNNFGKGGFKKSNVNICIYVKSKFLRVFVKHKIKLANRKGYILFDNKNVDIHMNIDFNQEKVNVSTAPIPLTHVSENQDGYQTNGSEAQADTLEKPTLMHCDRPTQCNLNVYLTHCETKMSSQRRQRRQRIISRIYGRHIRLTNVPINNGNTLRCIANLPQQNTNDYFVISRTHLT